jgi:hypothetical protein
LKREIKIAFASGTDELNVRLIERMRAAFPELPLYVVSATQKVVLERPLTLFKLRAKPRDPGKVRGNNSEIGGGREIVRFPVN